MRSNRIARAKSRRNKTPNDKELVEMKALQELGHSNYAIAKRTGINHHTVKKYLTECADAFNDPEMKEAVAKYAEHEIFDLVTLTAKARERLHERLPSMNSIEALAVMDRSFQQRRLLEGKSTQNIATLAKIIKQANSDLED